MSQAGTTVQLGLLEKAIVDAQSTIRAIDAKIGMLMVILVIPLTKLSSIVGHCQHYVSHSQWFLALPERITVGLFCVAWITAFLAALRTFAALDDPSRHVRVCGQSPSGVFYGRGLFASGALRCLFATGGRSSKDLDQHVKALPGSEAAAVRELAFEHMKLVYIRHVKTRRQQVSTYLGAAWVGIGGMIWIQSLLS